VNTVRSTRNIPSSGRSSNSFETISGVIGPPLTPPSLGLTGLGTSDLKLVNSTSSIFLVAKRSGYFGRDGGVTQNGDIVAPLAVKLG
jgi:hypothetical protein